MGRNQCVGQDRIPACVLAERSRIKGGAIFNARRYLDDSITARFCADGDRALKASPSSNNCSGNTALSIAQVLDGFLSRKAEGNLPRKLIG